MSAHAVTLPASTAALIDQAHAGLAAAAGTIDPACRFSVARLAALRATAALLSVHVHPGPWGRVRPPMSVWEALRLTVPELSEWADLFAAKAAVASAADAGLRSFRPDDADDLVRDVGTYLALIEERVAARTARLTLPRPGHGDPGTDTGTDTKGPRG